MSNDITRIEKQFFDTFGIEVRQTYGRKNTCNNYVNYNDCDGCNAYKYPQITDHILLELIVILGSIFISVQDKETLKDHILNQCIMNKDVIKHQVQALFKED